MTYTIGQLAQIARVTTRTLRHYDDIGLLSPSSRSGSGYRMYTEQDAHLLAEILVYRELEFSLDDIAAIVKADDKERRLQRQKELLIAQNNRIANLVEAIDHMIDSHKKGVEMTAEEVFNGFEHNEYEAEAEERWGNTSTWAESQRRVKGYTAQDWEHFKTESGAVSLRAIELMEQGVDASSDQAMDVAEDHRQLITRWFYDCTYEIHSGLADMYIADARFTKNIDAAKEGLAQYLHDAIKANCARQ